MKKLLSWDIIQARSQIEKICDRQMFSAPPRHHPENGNFKDEEYLAWIRTLPCTTCGRTDQVEAHHHWKTRNNDYTAVPLCRSCHEFGIHSARSQTTWQESKNINLEHEILRCLMLYLFMTKGLL